MERGNRQTEVLFYALVVMLLLFMVSSFFR
jgi:hypothetical protein